MSFADCIKNQLLGPDKQGLVTEKQASDLVTEYDDLVDRYTESMGDPSAAENAARQIIETKQAQIIEENQAKIKHAVYQKRLDSDIKKRVADQTQAYEQMNNVQKKINRKPSKHHVIGDLYQDVMTRQQTIARIETLKLVDFYNEHGSKLLGLVQRGEQLPNIVKSMLGENTPNDLSNKFGKQISEVFDSLHGRYKQAGGSIGKIPNYFPQTHNAMKLKSRSFEEWRDNILPRLDRENMIDYDTGLPMSDSKLRAQMEADYRAITTNGLSELAERMDRGLVTRGVGGDVFKRKQQSRFYRFKDAESFLEYNREFGVGDEGLFEAIGQHIQSMARDIALMEKMGPKPNAMARYFDVLMEEGGASRNQRNFVNGMYGLVSGRLSDFGTLPLLYRFMEGSKALSRFLLGGAALSAMPDATFVRMSLKMNGFDSVRGVKTYLNGLNPASPVTQRSMSRFTTVAQALQGLSLQSARFSDDLRYEGGKVVQTLNAVSSMIIRAGGLARMTEQGRMSVMSSVMGEFAEFGINKTPYAKLNKDLKSTLKRFNISAKDYDVIVRASPYIDETTGGSFITGADILNVRGVDRERLIDIAANYDDMVTRMAEIAVNEPTLRTRAITTGAALAPEAAVTGSGVRAIMSALGTFKGFPVTVMQNFVLPLARRAASGERADILNASEVLALTTLLGGAAYQAKAMARGEEARDMDDPKFWFAAAMQGGGMGIFGDFLFDDYSRFGHSLASTLAGPVVGLYGDALRVVNGNYNRALEEGKESKFLADAWDVGNRYIPGATLWYARLPLERMLINSVDDLLDDGFQGKVRRRERQMQRNEGRGYWWRPGDKLPS